MRNQQQERDQRERRLDAIRQHAERLQRISRAYDRLLWAAEKHTASNAFVDLAETAGKLATNSLQHVGDLLDIMLAAGKETDDARD